MAFDFPNAPTNGQVFTPPGGPTYTWDGVAWLGEAGGGGIAPHTHDHVESTTADMWAGVKDDEFAVNDQADGLGHTYMRMMHMGNTESRLILDAEVGDATLALEKGGSAYASQIVGRVGSGSRWSMLLGNTRAETGTDSGSDFSIMAHDDAGVAKGPTPALEIMRTNSSAIFKGGVVINGTTLDVNGGYSDVGAKYGISFNSYWFRQSSNQNTATVLQGFYNPTGKGGQISLANATTTYSTSSDANLKEVIGEYDPQTAIAIIRTNPVKTWTWKTAEAGQGVGWVAQESYAVDPSLAVPPPEPEPGKTAVPFGEEGYEPWGIDYGRRTPYLWAALTWALDKLDEQDTAIAALTARLDALESAGAASASTTIAAVKKTKK